MFEMIPLFGPVPGGMELAVILLIAVLLFGANKIPKLARSTGEAMGEFKKGREEVEQELQEMQSSGSQTAPSDVGEADAERVQNVDQTDAETSQDTETERESER
ncbi:twin-arginine translocase TatA/TatE family subunit [Halomicrococcus sp. NG-SE-24]|uniref:twin-arginine translocase TatA/TatE family subunit n=1 Tax=unclassified Halomicrococcus TaxID=2614448 RepID=UPI000DE14428|nr:twin-arginine translocase TatA/TatE family subunit [halophilic archaeon]